MRNSGHNRNMGERGNILFIEATEFGLIQAKLDALFQQKRFHYSGEAVFVSFDARYGLKNIGLLRQDVPVNQLKKELQDHIGHYAKDILSYERTTRAKFETKLKKDLPYCWIWYESRREKERLTCEKYQRLMAEKMIFTRSARNQLAFSSTLRLESIELHSLESIPSAQSFLEAFSECYQAFTHELVSESKRLLSIVGNQSLDERALSSYTPSDALRAMNPLYFNSEKEMSK
ncbi:MAG: hypothetical protein AABZ14_02145 [Candidatus Margulisiibacteriota bacterium]